MESATTPLPDFTDHRRRPGRKLGRFQQYCLYAAMQLGASNYVIAQTFNLSRTTVSALRHAGEHNRYMHVWSEYYRLGHRDFCNTYRDDIITARINEARKRELESLGYGLPRGRPAQMAQYDHPIDPESRYFALAKQWADSLAPDDPRRFSTVVTRPNSPESKTFLNAFAAETAPALTVTTETPIHVAGYVSDDGSSENRGGGGGDNGQSAP